MSSNYGNGIVGYSSPGANVFAPGVGGVVAPPGSAVIGTAIIRPSIAAGVVTWSFINDAQHQPIFFTSVQQSPDTPSRVRINFPMVTKVCTILVTDDETFAGQLTGVGATVANNWCDIQLGVTSQSMTMTYQGNGVTWVPLVGQDDVFPGQSQTGSRVLYMGSNLQGTPFENFDLWSAAYNGANNNILTRLVSGLGAFSLGFELRSAATGLAVAPQTNDYMTVTSGNPRSNDTSAYNAANSWLNQTNANLWVIGVFIL